MELSSETRKTRSAAWTKGNNEEKNKRNSHDGAGLIGKIIAGDGVGNGIHEDKGDRER